MSHVAAATSCCLVAVAVRAAVRAAARPHVRAARRVVNPAAAAAAAPSVPHVRRAPERRSRSPRACAAQPAPRATVHCAFAVRAQFRLEPTAYTLIQIGLPTHYRATAARQSVKRTFQRTASGPVRTGQDTPTRAGPWPRGGAPRGRTLRRGRRRGLVADGQPTTTPRSDKESPRATLAAHSRAGAPHAQQVHAHRASSARPAHSPPVRAGAAPQSRRALSRGAAAEHSPTALATARDPAAQHA